MKKSNFNVLIEFALIVAVISIVSILVFNINSDARADLTADTYAYNATQKSDEALYKIPANLKLLATAVVFGVVLWVILRVVPMAGVRVGGNSM